MNTFDIATTDADLLLRRAAQLARPAGAAVAEAGTVQVLEFSIAGQACLLGIDWVREVRSLGELLPVPLAPAQLLGLVQLRGQMLPVLDLVRLLGLTAHVAGGAQRLLVIGREAPAFGVPATEVNALRQLSPEQAEHRARPLEALRPEIVRGITPDGHLWLDGARLLALHLSAGS